jgi:hypothetical protein
LYHNHKDPVKTSVTHGKRSKMPINLNHCLGDELAANVAAGAAGAAVVAHAFSDHADGSLAGMQNTILKGGIILAPHFRASVVGYYIACPALHELPSSSSG